MAASGAGIQKKILFLALYFLSPALPILVIYFSNTYKYGDPGFLVPMILGASAYAWLNAELVLSARFKFIEKYFGMDRFYRFHGYMAVVSVALVFIHRVIELNVMGRFLTGDIGDKAWWIFVAVILLALVFMADTMVLKIKPLLMFRRYMEKQGISKYKYQVLLHNITITGLILLLIHVLLTSSAKTHLQVRLVFILYFSLGFGSYIYQKVVRRFILRMNEFIVGSIVRESHNVWTIRLLPRSRKIFTYQPGQFGFVRFNKGNVKPEEHPFSISSAPADTESISITVKELGDFTSKIGNLLVGSSACIDAPYGTFSYTRYPSGQGLVLIAGGIGITPIASMLRHLRSTDRHRHAILIWGVNEQRDIIFLEEFLGMQKEMDNFRFIPVVCKGDGWEGEKGIIDRSRISDIISTSGFDTGTSGFYVCGPSGMMRSVIKSLKQLGIKSSNIHYERFSL